MENEKSDKDLYKEFLNENHKSFEILISRYKANLIYFIMRYVKNRELAEDIFQDTMIYIIENKEKYNFEYSLKTYIYMIAKSRAINYCKKENKNIDFDEFEKFYTFGENDVEEKVFSNERQKKIRIVMGKLKPDYQTVIYLTQIEKFSYNDVAKIMNKDKSQIKTLVHNSKKKLKELLKEEGVVEMYNNKLVKILIMCMIVIVATAGLGYAVYNNYVKERKASINPVFTSNLSTIDDNIVWCGTFQLVWNDLMDELVRRTS